MDTSPTIRLTIAPEHDGQPLRELVIAALAGAPPSVEIPLDGELLMARGGLWVDGKRMRDMDARARAGAEVAIHRPLAGVYPDIAARAEQIIYEDEDLLALNKPAGVYVDSTPWDAEGNYHAALVRFIAARDGGTPTLHLAHRPPTLCLLRTVTGIPCPLCGGTTAAVRLGQGRPGAALLASPLAVLGAATFALWPWAPRAVVAAAQRHRMPLILGLLTASELWQLHRFL